MITLDSLMSEETPPLQPSDTVDFGLGLMMELRVRHLPVVGADGKLVGLVSEEQLLDAESPDAPVGSVMGPRPIRAEPHLHAFDVAKLMSRHNLTTLPVTDEQGQYQGLIRRYDLFESFARLFATHEAGAILAVEVEPRNYSLSQLIYTIEQNDVRVLSVATEMPSMENGNIAVTIKVNVTDVSRVKHMLEHRGYHVVAAFGQDETDDDFRLRIEEFMRYLEV